MWVVVEEKNKHNLESDDRPRPLSLLKADKHANISMFSNTKTSVKQGMEKFGT